jgi:hypothetical protein
MSDDDTRANSLSIEFHTDKHELLVRCSASLIDTNRYAACCLHNAPLETLILFLLWSEEQTLAYLKSQVGERASIQA